MSQDKARLGVTLALICLVLLGIMPVITGGRPAGFGALSFAFCLCVWQLMFSLPLTIYELIKGKRGILTTEIAPKARKRTVLILLLTGALFGLSTFVYVYAVEKAGPTNTAIAIQAYPLFAILWETLFLGRRKNRLEMVFTLTLLLAMTYLALEGSLRLDGVSIWFLTALGVPLLWSIAHVIIKEVLDSTPITPSQVTLCRVAVSCLLLGSVILALQQEWQVLEAFSTPAFQRYAIAMGLVYYLELIFWFYAVKHIAVSLASSITVPWPALTMLLAVLFLDESVMTYQIAAFMAAAGSVYGLIFSNARKMLMQSLQENRS